MTINTSRFYSGLKRTRFRVAAGSLLAILLVFTLIGTSCIDCQAVQTRVKSPNEEFSLATNSLDSGQQVSKSKKSPPKNGWTEGVGPQCQYEKGQWQDCSPDGFQVKVQQLKPTLSRLLDCQQFKTIRRDCKPVGCKYARGQWSGTCHNGQRVRIDRLVARLGQDPQQQQNNCQPLRRVTKDCRRTCHYVKSAWGECSSGWQSRNLTLADSMRPDEYSSSSSNNNNNNNKPKLVSSISALGRSCAKFKLMRRECRMAAAAPGTGAGATLPAAGSANSSGANSGPITLAQRRRLKQLQRLPKQKLLKQQQASQTSTPSSKLGPTSSSSSTTTTTTISTSTTPTQRQARR